jgi:hypothetical protein
MEYGGPGTEFGGLVRKTGPTVAGLDGPTVRRSVDLPPIYAEGCGCSGYEFISIP